MPRHAPARRAHYGLATLLSSLSALACSSHDSHAPGSDASFSTQLDATSESPPAIEDARTGSAAPDADTPIDTALRDAAVAPDPSSACGGGDSTYAPGTTAGQLASPSTRTFRVHVPPAYDGNTARPLLLMFHGGGGSGRQFEEASADMDPIADREQFITVYPDGSGTLRSWNGGGCCAYAVDHQIDDVGFVASLLDHLESRLCIDRRRVFASGMSNGAILSHRLACELAERIAAIAPVSGTDMTSVCTPARPVAVMEVHGTSDGHIPWDGGVGCGATSVAFTSVPDTIARWRSRNGCATSSALTFEQGDGRCETYSGCQAQADVTLCSMAGDGHSWPGGQPPADLTPCPGNGPQSSSFHASEAIWSFFAMHPKPAD